MSLKLSYRRSTKGTCSATIICTYILGVSVSCSQTSQRPISPDSPEGIVQSKQIELLDELKRGELTKPDQTCSVRRSGPATNQQAARVNSEVQVVVMKQNELAEGRPNEKASFSPKGDHDQQGQFAALTRLIDSQKLKSILALNCKGQMIPTKEMASTTSQTKYYGWTAAELSLRADTADLARIRAPALLKIQSKYKDSVNVECAGDEELERKALLKLSDIRGSAGFYLRLKENKGNALKVEFYLTKARELYSIPINATVDQAIERVLAQMKISLTELDQINHQRFELLQKRIQSLNPDQFPAIVLVNGNEVRAIQDYLERSSQKCQIIQSNLYKDSEQTAIQQLRDLTK